MNKELVDWQKIDPSNGLCYPWLTHPFLQVLERWDLSNMRVVEYGGGRSTAWLRKKCEIVVTIETKWEFYMEIKAECAEHQLSNGLVLLKEVNEGDRTKERQYVEAPMEFVGELTYDIVIVDGIFRYECMRYAIDILLQKGGILIVDNWHQDGFLCPACEDLVRDYEGYIFPQEDHTDHHGNCWKTAYFVIPKA